MSELMTIKRLNFKLSKNISASTKFQNIDIHVYIKKKLITKTSHLCNKIG